jgi:ABC-2 type transport system ATP-binding protein
MHRPDLLVLDEPSSGLDPLLQAELRSLLRETAAEGRTVFLSSHSLDEVQHVADRVGIIRNGRLADVDAVERLRKRALRHVTILFAEPVDATRFAALDGVRVEGSDGSVLRLSAPEPAMDARQGGRGSSGRRSRFPAGRSRGDLPRALRGAGKWPLS